MNSAKISNAADDHAYITSMTSSVADHKALVVVGVRLDSQSRELLTWAIVKAAQPGDCVIALHVLPEGTASLLSLVKAFDSVLAVYEGLCTLKQVDLKFKVCKGCSVRKLLVSEVKSYAASKLVLGISKALRTVRSSTSVAKYCSVKLAPSCSVLAVENGKIVFMRKAANDSTSEADFLQDAKWHKKITEDDEAVNEKLKVRRHVPVGKDTNRKTKANYEAMSDTLALVPLRRSNKFGWVFSRKMFVLDWLSRPKSEPKELHKFQWPMRLSNQFSSTIHPDQKLNQSAHCEENSTNVPGGIGSGLAPLSLTPYHDLSDLPKELQCLPDKYSSLCRFFSLMELMSATSNFVPENMVGRGGGSWVYRGCLPDGKEVAVKVLKPTDDTIKEFVSEIEIITNVSHKNIVSLFGFSIAANYLLLVYEYLPRGSLEAYLHGNKKDASEFGWNERYKVALGVAEALTHLHHTCNQPVIHKDVKSSNILLSDDFEPRLSDFGFAQSASASVSCMACIDVAGTFGYLAPEYLMHGEITDKIDVYAFGVVLLELLSSRKPINNDNESLVMWAKTKLDNGLISDLLDPYLRLDIGCSEIERMVLAARLCIRQSPKSRPQMSTILKLLQGDQGVSDWAKQLTLVPDVLGCMDDDEELEVSSDIESHLHLALLDLEVDDALSVSNTEHNMSLGDYLQITPR